MRRISGVWPLVTLVPVLGVAGACNNSSSSGPSDSGGSQGQMDAASLPPGAGGTGAFGIVTIGGKQKMYLPQTTATADGKFVVAVVDVSAAGDGVNGAPALITDIDLGTDDAGDLEYATATGGDSSMVVAVSTDFPRIWFIDPNMDVVVKTLDLDPNMYGQSSFSGGGGYVTGVAIDSANHRAILSVWNGFALVDLTTQTITSVIQAPPSENFGFDSAHQRILAPFYSCTSSALNGVTMPSSCATPLAPDGTNMTDGLSVIDLTDGTVYTYENPGDDDSGLFFGPTSEMPVGSEPDSAAADPATGVVVVPSEGGGFTSVIDLSKATFDKTAKTVTAPQQIVQDLSLTGVAVEYTKHLGFWEEEHGNDVAVADLTQITAGGTAWVHGFMPDLPGDAGETFENLGDPHGIAVTTALVGGGPVGFVVDTNRQWVARVDLAKMVTNESGDASTELEGAMMAPYVTYLDANTKE
jgi:hypothetical protein